MEIKQTILKHGLAEAFMQGSFGLEKESLRVKKQGELALTDHPAVFGSRSHHPYIQTDFSESQLELVTPAAESIEETFRWLVALHDVALRSLPEDEWMWPFSMPGELPSEDTIPIVKVEEQSEIEYREELARKYGKRKQMISGLHVNFGFDPEFVRSLHEHSASASSLLDFSNELHMKLARNFIRYRWLLTYLLGASPYAEPDYYLNGSETTPPTDYVRSLRNSSFGYHNTQAVQVSYESIEQYAADIQQLTKEQLLVEEREFYGSARARGAKEVKDLAGNGIKYVEFRSIDIDPFAEFGVSMPALRFIHLFLLLLVWMDDDDKSVEKLKLGNKMNEQTGMEHPFEPSQYQEEGRQLLKQMEDMADSLQTGEDWLEMIHRAQDMMEHPEQTFAARLVKEMKKGEGYLGLGERLASEYKAEALEKPFLLRGFEKMEMSTQLLVFDALQKGIEVDVLDEHDQFLRLSYKDHVEYVKNANMTSKDTYIAPLIMENKTVTKKILAEHGFYVPGGDEYVSASEAKAHYWKYEDKRVVVKPKSTNYGLGISVFKEPASPESFEEAIDLAFKEDTAVLVEDYAPGTEYRFFVADGETKAVLLRIPANVVGDGTRTVKELVEEKNQHPFRGENHRAPMEKIQLGEIERLMLKEQGLDITSVPEEGRTVYLRENSNISTGGDSIDFTDEMDDSYKQIAARITETLEARVSGVDLIIPDHTKPSTTDNPGYTVIEANFNPAMHMHAYVQEGKGRRLTKDILAMLFPELKEEIKK